MLSVLYMNIFSFSSIRYPYFTLITMVVSVCKTVIGINRNHCLLWSKGLCVENEARRTIVLFLISQAYWLKMFCSQSHMSAGTWTCRVRSFCFVLLALLDPFDYVIARHILGFAICRYLFHSFSISLMMTPFLSNLQCRWWSDGYFWHWICVWN